MDRLALSRRNALLGGAALAGAAAGGLPGGEALAKAPMLKTQTPYFPSGMNARALLAFIGITS